MAGPWEKYQTAPAAGPWQKYAAPEQPEAAPEQSGTPTADTIATGVGGFLEGIPVVGPMIRGGVERAAAAADAAISDRTYEGNMKFLQGDNERLKQEHPYLNAGAQVAGAVAGTIPMVAAAPAAFGASKAPMIARMAASGATGAAMGGADALVRSGGDPEAVKNGVLWGGGLGVAGPPVAAAAGKVVGGIAKRVRPSKIPTINDLQAAKTAAYKTADGLGAKYSAPAISDAIDDIGARLTKARINPARHPKAASMLADLQKMKGQEFTLTEMDQLRQVIRRDVANAPDGAEQYLGRKMIEAIDDFIDGADATKMVAGSADEAGAAIRNARALNTRFRKAEIIDEALTKARRAAAKSGSGGNVNNAIRQRISSILDNKKKAAQFTAEEIKLMEEVVAGTRGENVLRLIGKLSPSGNGLMAALGLGATVTNPALAIGPGAGIVAKSLADGATTGRATSLEALIRTGGQPPVNSLAQLAGMGAQTMTRGLMGPTVPSTVQQLQRR